MQIAPIVDMVMRGEIRIHHAAGYRLYYTIRNLEIVILLCGGDKSSQKKDIKKAKELAQEV